MQGACMFKLASRPVSAEELRLGPSGQCRLKAAFPGFQRFLKGKRAIFKADPAGSPDFASRGDFRQFLPRQAVKAFPAQNRSSPRATR